MPHYSVNYREFLHLRATLAPRNIPLVIFGKEENSLKPNLHEVMVINKFNNEHRWFRYFKYDETKAWIMNTKQVDKKRKVKAKHIAISASVANAWQRRSVGTVVVKKPGFSGQICTEHRLAVSRALGIMGMNLRNIMLREHIPIFHHKDRNKECSNQLGLKLNSKHDVFFEGVSVQLLENGLGIHVDRQNDSTPGYNWSGVLAMTRNSTRLTINGYSRKCAKDFMIRLNKANHNV